MKIYCTNGGSRNGHEVEVGAYYGIPEITLPMEGPMRDGVFAEVYKRHADEDYRINGLIVYEYKEFLRLDPRRHPSKFAPL